MVDGEVTQAVEETVISGENVANGDEERNGPEEDIERNFEVQKPNTLADPGQPSASERAIHDMLHMPFRTWCYDCLPGQGKD